MSLTPGPNYDRDSDEDDCDSILFHHVRTKNRKKTNKKVRFDHSKPSEVKTIEQIDREISENISRANSLDAEFDNLDRMISKSNSSINFLESVASDVEGQTCAVAQPDWERFKITIDSGAAQTVCGKSDFGKTPINPSVGSQNGGKFMSASGNYMPNLGEKSVAFATDDWQGRNMKFQVCDVTKPLASVSDICKKGHRVVFDADWSYIEHKESGRPT